MENANNSSSGDSFNEKEKSKTTNLSDLLY